MSKVGKYEFINDSGMPVNGTGAGLPMTFKRLALYTEICSVYPPGIDFPNKVLAKMHIATFLANAVAFALSYRFLIIISLLLFAYAVVYNHFVLKLEKALLLSSVKTKLFSAFLFLLGAAAGLSLRYLIFK